MLNSRNDTGSDPAKIHYEYLNERIPEVQRLQTLSDVSIQDYIIIYDITYHIIALLEKLKDQTASKEILQKINFLRNRVADNLDQLFSKYILNENFLSIKFNSIFNLSIGIYQEVMQVKKVCPEPFANHFLRCLKQKTDENLVDVADHIVSYLDVALQPLLAEEDNFDDKSAFENAIKIALCEIALSIRILKDDIFDIDVKIFGEKIVYSSPSLIHGLLNTENDLTKYSISKILATCIEARNSIMHLPNSFYEINGKNSIILAKHLLTLRDEIENCIRKYKTNKKSKENINANSLSTSTHSFYYQQQLNNFINQNTTRSHVYYPHK